MTRSVLTTVLLFGILVASSADAAAQATHADVSYGPDPEQGLDIHSSPAADRRGTFVFLHGGGYYLDDKSGVMRYVEPLVAAGYDVVNMNYRLKRGIPPATEDLVLALDFLLANAATYGLDLDRVVVGGFSAGAQIATNVALAQNDEGAPFRADPRIGIVAAVNFAGPVDRLGVTERLFVDHEVELISTIGKALFPDIEGYAPDEVLAAYEPLTYLDDDDPAVFLWHGGEDDQILASTFERFVARLDTEGGKDHVIFVPEAGHSPTDAQLEAAYEELLEFLAHSSVTSSRTPQDP